MNPAPRRDEWESICALLRQYTLRKYGLLPAEIRVTLTSGATCREVVPLSPPGLIPPCGLRVLDSPPADRRTDAFAGGPEPKRYSDCQRVYWPGLGDWTFSPKQAKVVAALWEARFDSAEPDVDQAALLVLAGSDGSRLLDLFRRGGRTHPAWAVLILPGERAASFRLPELPDTDTNDE